MDAHMDARRKTRRYESTTKDRRPLWTIGEHGDAEASRGEPRANLCSAPLQVCDEAAECLYDAGGWYRLTRDVDAEQSSRAAVCLNAVADLTSAWTVVPEKLTHAALFDATPRAFGQVREPEDGQVLAKCRGTERSGTLEGDAVTGAARGELIVAHPSREALVLNDEASGAEPLEDVARILEPKGS